jgi:hypothetical protein
VSSNQQEFQQQACITGSLCVSSMLVGKCSTVGAQALGTYHPFAAIVRD